MGTSRALLLLSLALCCVQSAPAQERAIPADAKRGYIAYVHEAVVSLNGAQARLAPGATIRDQGNLIIVPSAMPREGAWADYVVDMNGQVFRVWLLTPAERATRRKAAP